jgi:hypothetical protein
MPEMAELVRMAAAAMVVVMVTAVETAAAMEDVAVVAVEINSLNINKIYTSI